MVSGAPGRSPGRAAPRRRRRRWLVAFGVLLGSLGLVTTVGGAVGTVAYDAWASTAPTAEARAPGRVTFDARDATYEILLVRRRGANLGDEAASTRCTVDLVDGRRVEIDGRVQRVSVSGGSTATVGSFTAVPGHTSVRCEGADEGRTFVVDAVSDAERWWARAMWGGLIVLVVGVGVAVLGWLWIGRPTSTTGLAASPDRRSQAVGVSTLGPRLLMGGVLA